MKTTLKITTIVTLACLLILPACGGGGGGGGSTPTIPTYTVTYNENGADSGSVPVDSTDYEQGDEVTVLGNTGSLARNSYTFAGWCVNADGTGDSYAQDETFTMGSSSVILYAKWTPVYRVTYDGNGADSGSVPVDSTDYEQGDEVTVSGNAGSLARDGYSFAGWCVNADGTGDSYAGGDTFTMGSADSTLYAKWSSTTTGIPDTDFDTDGIVTTSVGTISSSIQAMCIQEDGKIVVAGYTWEGAIKCFAVVRYNTDGTADTSFGSSGTGIVTTTPEGAIGSSIQAMCIQGDGKIVAAGYADYGSNTKFAVIRYNTDGTVDTSFGSSGIVTTQVESSSTEDKAYAMCIQGDGKIVAAGYTYEAGNAKFAVVRYNTGGTVDTSFGSSGIVTTQVEPSSTEDVVNAMCVQGDGKIVAAGYTDYGSNYDFALVRYDPTGSLDLTFDTDGIVTTQVGTGDDKANAMRIQGDGKIVAAGYSYNSVTDKDFALVRYNSNGSADTDFGTSGIITTAVDSGTGEDRAYALCIQDDGKIVAAGKSNDGTSDNFALVRYSNGL